MLLFKLWGGNVSSRTPGDPANMFSYTGPPGIKVRGVLNDEELQMAVSGGRYLRGVHAVVATPDMALALSSLKDSPLSFQVGVDLGQGEVKGKLARYSWYSWGLLGCCLTG